MRNMRKKYKIDDLIRQIDAAAITGVSRQRISQLIADGVVSTIDVAGYKFLRKSEIKLIDARCKSPGRKAGKRGNLSPAKIAKD